MTRDGYACYFCHIEVEKEEWIGGKDVKWICKKCKGELNPKKQGEKL